MGNIRTFWCVYKSGVILYTHYGWTKTAICHKWDINFQTLRSLENISQKSHRVRRVSLTAITQEEKQNVIEYALNHTQYNHREMTFRMIDENVAYMSISSVYRILRENNLLQSRESKRQNAQWDPHKKLTEPDQVWQTDLMVVDYANRDYYHLTYLDVFSRFAVYNELCLSMTGDSINQASKRALARTGSKPEIIQSDNGSCYISSEYTKFIFDSGIDHKRIHAHCPNENAEIERYHRTLRELVDPTEPEEFTALVELFKERIRYYNYERYHSAIGYVTPYDKYTGRAEKIFKERKRKLEKAREQ
jgi:transposase InsO family protein